MARLMTHKQILFLCVYFYPRSAHEHDKKFYVALLRFVHLIERFQIKQLIFLKVLQIIFIRVEYGKRCESFNIKSLERKTRS